MIEGEKKGKSVLICGLAPCLMDDFNEARLHRPDAELIIVNYTCSEIAGDYLFTLHPEQIEQMKKVSLKPEMPVLSSSNPEKYGQFPVDVWIPMDKFNGATSGYAATRAAYWMGYDEIIMCGCPLEESNRSYYGNYKKTWEYRPRQIQQYADKFAEYYDRFPHEKIRSMSGYTKQVLGAPAWQQTFQSAQTH